MSRIFGYLSQKWPILKQISLKTGHLSHPHDLVVDNITKSKKYQFFEIFVYLPLNNTVKRWQKYSKR